MAVAQCWTLTILTRPSAERLTRSIIAGDRHYHDHSLAPRAVAGIRGAEVMAFSDYAVIREINPNFAHGLRKLKAQLESRIEALQT